MTSQTLNAAAVEQTVVESMKQPSWTRACVGFAASTLMVVAAPLLLAAF